MLSLKDLEKSYDGKKILDKVTFSVEKGKCVGLISQNSGGKTTTLSIVAGITKKDGGEVLQKGKVALVPQKEVLMEQLTVRENIELFYASFSLNKSEMFCENSYEHRMSLDEFAKVKVKNLSGGRKKRLSICLALISNADIILLDEPFSGLDIPARREVINIVNMLKADNKAILITGHEVSEMYSCCDKVLLMNIGQIKSEITPKEISIQEFSNCICKNFEI